MKIIAITGSIGCGKTTIANVLRKLGYLVYDIDKWVKYLYYKPRFLAMIERTFPETFVNGKFDKRKLRNIVFDNPAQLDKLEKIIHPLLKKRFLRVIRHNRKNPFNSVIFVDIALLYEMGWEKYFDDVILAYADYNVQKKRVMLRDHVTEEDFEKINSVQIPSEEKMKQADIVLNTNENMVMLKKEIVDLLRGL